MKITNVAIVALLTAASAYALKGELNANVDTIISNLDKPEELKAALTVMEFTDDSTVFDSFKTLSDKDAKKKAVEKVLNEYKAKEDVAVGDKIKAIQGLRDKVFIKYDDLKGFLAESANEAKVSELKKSLTGKQIEDLKGKTGYISTKNLTALLTGVPLSTDEATEETRLSGILAEIESDKPEDNLKAKKADLKLSDADIAAIMKEYGEDKDKIDEMDELVKVLDAAKAAKPAETTTAAAVTTSSSSADATTTSTAASSTPNNADAVTTTTTSPSTKVVSDPATVSVEDKIKAIKALKEAGIPKYEDLKAFIEDNNNEAKVTELKKSLTEAQITTLKEKTGYISTKNLTAMLNGKVLEGDDAKEEERLAKILVEIESNKPEDNLKAKKADLKLSDADIAAIMKEYGEDKDKIDEMDELVKVLAAEEAKNKPSSGSGSNTSALTDTSTTANATTSDASSSSSGTLSTVHTHLQDNMMLYIFGAVGLVVLILAAYVMTRKSDPTEL